MTIYSIVLAARRVEQLQQVANDCKKHGASDVLTVATDVTREQDCKYVVIARISLPY
jgi:NADP-dependent 3-hydroxy acid dehydrogenase YdfG